MTCIHSLRLTGETTETHAGSGGELCGYDGDAGVVPSGNHTRSSRISFLVHAKICAWASGYLTPFPGDWEGKRRVQNLRLCRGLPSCLYLANLLLWYDSV